MVCDSTKRPLPEALVGQHVHVRVHLNLHNGCYVVSLGGKVQGYTEALMLRDVTTAIMPAGYAACRDEQVRNVHAYLVGTLVEAGVYHSPPAGWKRLRYNCLTGPPCFVLRDESERCLTIAPAVLALPGGHVWVAPGYSTKVAPHVEAAS